MRKKSFQISISIGMTLIFYACITVNIYFPEAAVQKTAEKIVDEIRENDTDKKEEKKEEKKIPSFSEQLNLSSFFIGPALYGQEETTVSTPTIRALKRSMTERFPQLVPFYDSGHIGESNDGYLDKRNEDNLDLKTRAELRKLFREENKDREDLYREVAAALNIDQSQIPRIQKIFAQNWIRKARPGWWIQKEDGNWERKK
jgi:uncharacterized protein YdbL (DUF1318 family)